MIFKFEYYETSILFFYSFSLNSSTNKFSSYRYLNWKITTRILWLLQLKTKKNKTTALVLLGTGTAIAIGTLISYSNGTTDGFGGNVPTEFQTVMFSIGGASVLVSIPFFISANKNKRKAALHLKNSISRIKSTQNRNLNYLSASLTITF